MLGGGVFDRSTATTPSFNPASNFTITASLSPCSFNIVSARATMRLPYTSVNGITGPNIVSVFAARAAYSFLSSFSPSMRHSPRCSTSPISKVSWIPRAAAGS